MTNKIFSIGHSVMKIDKFLGLIKDFKIDAIADVRTTPFSRYHPHFNKENLKKSLADAGVAYSFLGVELGGRPDEDNLYDDDIADYEEMAKTNRFQEGISRVVEGSKKFSIALMCTEKNPLECHRCLLVSRKLADEGFEPIHIMSDGRMETQKDIEKRILNNLGMSLFAGDDVLNQAYREQSKKIAFKRMGAGMGRVLK